MSANTMVSVKNVVRILVAAVLLSIVPAYAIDTNWCRDPGDSGDWYDPDNWDSGVPGDGDDAYVDNGGTAQIWYGTCRADIFAGHDSTGTIHQTGGTVSPHWHIRLGQNAGSSGQYLFGGGVISNANSNIYVGWYGQGAFTQDGGSIQSLNMLSVARDDGSTGVYDFKSGTIESRLVKIGQHGVGQFVHTGGSFNCPDRFYLATERDARGTYTLNGTGVLTTAMEFVGFEGLGEFWQNGGTHNVSDELTLGQKWSARGEYVISGGSLDAKCLNVAYSGTAMFKVSGSHATISAETYVQAAGGELVSEITTGGLSTIRVSLVATLDGTWEILDNGARIGRFDVLIADAGMTGSFDSVLLPGPEWSWGIESGNTLWVEHIPLSVETDIKPGSDPNPINLGSSGVVPVAILTTADFDATTVDPETVELAGASVATRGKGNRRLADEEDVDDDGDLDLVVHVETQELDLPPEATTAVLTGETYDGTEIEGSDSIVIVPK